MVCNSAAGWAKELAHVRVGSAAAVELYCENWPEGKDPPVELEGVDAVSMRRLLLQVLWQVDDHDCLEGAFLQQDRSGSSSAN